MTITIAGKMSIPRTRGRVRMKSRLIPRPNIGTLWMICGDSQTQGRAPAPSPCENPGNAFRLIYNENEGASVTTFTNLGEGGSSLAATNSRYHLSSARTTRTWVHSQESGSQSDATQDTAAEFKAVLIDHIRDIYANTPGAIISYEWPNNFDRGPEGTNESARNWYAAYAAVTREALDELLRDYGIKVYMAEVDRNIEALEVYNSGGITIAKSDVWYTDSLDPLYAHYTYLGNFMVALSMLVALGRDVRTWTFTSITDVTANQKTACLAIINRFAAADGLI